MAGRRSVSVPTYRHHKQSGQAIVTLVDPFGRRRDVLLGRHGTADSRVEYARVIAEWEARGRTLPPQGRGPAADITVNEVIVRYWHFAGQHYRRPDGTATNELNDVKLSLRPLRELYGHTPAKDFGPLALKSVRARMIDSGLCRGVVNQRVGRVKRMFKWATGEQIVPPTILYGLQAVAGLQRGRSPAPDREPVKPVPDEHVDAVLALATTPVRTMIELQRYSGMRPGEVCAMRPCDIDTTGKVWLYRPAVHKTMHRGKPRVVALGPKAQGIIKPLLPLKGDDYLFSPRRAVEEQRAARRASRVVPINMKQEAVRALRRKPTPGRGPGECYTGHSYNRVIAYLCVRAGVPTWSPNKLRHNYATDIRRRFGLEAAQVLLGHSKADVTQVYAERDLSLAERIAAEVG